MLSPTASTLRLVLHVLAATIWVGGQFTLAGLVPALRRHAPTAVKVAAQAYNRIAWPAFAVLVATGIWNLMELDITAAPNDYQVTLMLKILVAVVAGIAAAAHAHATSKLALALGGAIGAIASLAAVALGVLLRSGV
jgi:putative copper export protein